MNPPKELIDRMLPAGQIGLLASMCCLMVAYAVKVHGDKADMGQIEAQDPLTHEPVPPEIQLVLREAMRVVFEELKRSTPDQIDYAIAMYTAHLRAAGYNVEMGRDN